MRAKVRQTMAKIEKLQMPLRAALVDLLDSIREVIAGGAPMNGMIARQVIEVFRK
jgi:hypothetical protein